MSKAFLFAFTLTATIAAGGVDFVNQTKVTGGIGAREYLAALPGRLGAQKQAAQAKTAAASQPVSTSSAAGQVIDQDALRQQMAAAASQIAAASATTQSAPPADPAAAAGAASAFGALLARFGMGGGQRPPAADEPIRPAAAGMKAAVKPVGLGTCNDTGLGKRCKIGD